MGSLTIDDNRLSGLNIRRYGFTLELCLPSNLVLISGPKWMVGGTVFEMRLGSL